MAPEKDLLQLARYIRDAFTAQPTRRFIQGFFLHDTTMELWVFDRSGPYSSGDIDIHEEPEKFIRAIARYAMMDDEELGLDTFTELDDKGRFIIISEDATGKENRMRLDRAPFVKQRAVVCRGTTCFRSSDQATVVKISWTSDKRLQARCLPTSKPNTQQQQQQQQKMFVIHGLGGSDKTQVCLKFAEDYREE